MQLAFREKRCLIPLEHSQRSDENCSDLIGQKHTVLVANQVVVEVELEQTVTLTKLALLDEFVVTHEVETVEHVEGLFFRDLLLSVKQSVLDELSDLVGGRGPVVQVRHVHVGVRVRVLLEDLRW